MNTPIPHNHRRKACYPSVWSTLKVQTCPKSSINKSRADPNVASSPQVALASTKEHQQIISSDTHYRFDDIEGHLWDGKEYFFVVRWGNGEITHEPMSILKEDDPHSLAAYLQKVGLAKKRITCRWANNEIYMPGSSSEEEDEDPGPKQHHNKNTATTLRSYGLRSGSRNGDNLEEEVPDVEYEGLTEEQILDAKRSKRRAKLDNSREERRVKRKIEVALDLASKCAQLGKVAVDEEEGALFHMLGQLGNDSYIGLFEQSPDDKLFRCPVCLGPFDSSLSELHSKRDSNLPVRSAACIHKICCNCLTHMQLASSGGSSIPPKWLKCPVCKQSTAFDAINMPIDLFVCQCMDRIESKTYTLSAAISLSSCQHRTIASLYARASKGSNLNRLSSDQTSKKLMITKRKLSQAQRSVKRKSQALEVVEKELVSVKGALVSAKGELVSVKGELVSVKGELARVHKTLKQLSCEANNKDDIIGSKSVKEELLSLRPDVARANVKYQEKYHGLTENWFGRLEDLIGSSVAVIEDYEARGKVERAKREVLIQENAMLVNEIAKLKAQLQTHLGPSERCNATSVLEDII